MSINIEKLLKEISLHEPAGPNLEYDEEYKQLERSVDQRSSSGEAVNWKKVQKTSEALLLKTKSLDVSIWLARSLIHNDGWIGFSLGLELIFGLVEKYWSDLHPLLDPGDNNDPTMRINRISALCDRQATLVGLLDAPLVSSKQIGCFTLRDYKIARGELEPLKDAEREPAEMSLIAAAFKDAEAKHLKDVTESLDALPGLITKFSQMLVEKVGSASSIDFRPLIKVVEEAKKIVDEHRVEESELVEAESPGTPNSKIDEVKIEAKMDVSGSISSREEAAKMMDKISEYYMLNEPSSPVPLLMQRAKKLSTLGFLEILKELAPDGLKQAQSASGAALEVKK